MRRFIHSSCFFAAFVGANIPARREQRKRARAAPAGAKPAAGPRNPGFPLIGLILDSLIT
jgi:hypothetical protein